MHFTLLFARNSEGTYLAYDLVYHPTAIWSKNGEYIYNTKDTSYQLGFLEFLLVTEKKAFDNFFENHTGNHPISVTIVCHRDGHGTEECLLNLIQDLESNNYNTIVASL
jgi:hypothetical protein